MRRTLLRIWGCVLVLGACGCLASEDNLDDQLWRCDAHGECGAGWKCHRAIRTCERAYDGVHGVFADRLVLGMVGPIAQAPLVPGAEFIGRAGRDGIRSVFAHVNRTGGIAGRRLELLVADDQYNPELTRTLGTEMLEGPNRKVFALVTAVGTDPSLVAKELAQQYRVLFYAPGSGAEEFEPPQTDRYVFNFRARYSQEIEQLIEYMTKRSDKLVGCGNVAIFTSVEDADGTPDSISKAAFDGGKRAMRTLCQVSENEVKFVTYRVNTIDVQGAIRSLLVWMADPKRAEEAESDGTIRIGIPMLPAFDSGGAFVKWLTDQLMRARKLGEVDATYAPKDGFTTSELAQLAKIEPQFGVSSNTGPAMTLGLQSLGTYETEVAGVRRRYGAGTIFASPVPGVDSGSTGVRDYREHLEAYKQELPEDERAAVVPSLFSLEGYLAATLLGEALKVHGRDLTMESFIDTLESLQGVRLGVGPVFGFSEDSHQAIKKLWGLQLDEDLNPVDLGLLSGGE